MFTLSRINVVDLGERAATAWCSRLLADFGAEVLAVEPPGGHPLRRHPPFDAAGRSIPARYFLANKASAQGAEGAALQVAPPAGRGGGENQPATGGRELAQPAGLLRDAHVIVVSGQAADVAAAHPHAIVCAITAHGMTGARRAVPGNELTAAARSGWASVNGFADGAPLKGSGYQAALQSGTLAFGAVVCALVEQLNAGAAAPGQLIDISEHETLVSTFGPAPLRAQYSGYVWPRQDGPNLDEGPLPVSDGHFALPLSRPAFWRKAMHLLGLPDLAEDGELQPPGLRTKFKQRYMARVQERMAQWNRQDLFDALAAERVVAGPVFRMDEMAENPQFHGRGFFVRSPEGARFPGPPARMGESEWRLRREMGAVGADAGGFRVQGDWRERPAGAASDEVPAKGGQGVRVPARGKGPLSGFRGLVLTQAWAGTYATELLALHGAEVIQLETRNRLDSWRGTYQNPIPKRLRGTATARHAWNCSPLYNSVNLNKRCITVDLSQPAGVSLFKRLVPHMDFVADNFSPRVMGNFGLDYASLGAIKPDLVMASLSAYGTTGPWANVPGIGGTIEPSSGMSSVLGYEGGAPQNSGQMYPDPVAGLYGFATIALALLHRRRTGKGQCIDLSMQEANFTFIGDAWLEFEATGRVRGPLGNRHPLFAPHGIYPAAGEDEWLAVAVETDAQWRACCDVLGVDGDRWPDAASRKANEAAVDAAVATVVAKGDKTHLEGRLCDAGVPAAAVRDAAEVARDETLRERGHLVQVPHAEAGAMWQSGMPAVFSRTPGAVVSPAPLHGEHSFEVFERFLGMTRAEYEALEATGVTGAGEYKP